MKIKHTVGLLSVIAIVAITKTLADSSSGTVTAGVPEGPKLETLMSTVLEGAAGTEVIVSRIQIPPNTSLPKHWHPGEEFIYILEGSATLWLDGEDDVEGAAGDIIKVPFKKVHTGITGEQGVTAIVFRVHEEGEPQRVLVE